MELIPEANVYFGNSSIARVTDKELLALQRQSNFRSGPSKGSLFSSLTKAIDKLGVESAKEQQLNQPLTVSTKLLDPAGTQRLYILFDEGKLWGILKVGQKKLFLYDKSNKMKEKDSFCVLDFYIHSSGQRKGLGRKLFDAMLKLERQSPENIAYDRPSPKLVAFLKRHFGLTNGVLQPNKYFIFPT